ncbi:MAG: hypothetical protein NVS2B16_05130 [Chloroflexota bacterium]
MTTPNATTTDDGSAVQPAPDAVPMTYKQAKYLAASDRRDGVDAYAVYKVASKAWYVKHIN